MHRAQLRRSFTRPSPLAGAEPGAAYMPPPGLRANISSPMSPATIKETTGTGTQVRRPYPVSMHSLRQTVGRSVYRSVVEPLGIWGWSSELAMGGHPFDSDIVMANAGERVSQRREFWNLMNSGGGGMSEYIRRFYPRQRKQIERWNPLGNRQPGWMPGGIGCLIGESSIHTERGIVPIKELTPRDRVIGIDGRLHDIVTIADHGRSDDIWELATRTTRSKIYGTGDHRIPTFIGNKCRYYDQLVCVPRSKKCCARCCNHNNVIELVDTPISEIMPKDYVTYPIIHNTDHIPVIDLAECYEGVYTDNYVYSSNISMEYAQCLETYDNNPQLTRRELMDMGFDGRISRRVIHTIDNDLTIKVRDPRFIEVTSDVAYLIGWWLAEGTTNGKVIDMSLSLTELDYANELASIIHECLGRRCNIFNSPGKSVYSVQFTFMALSRYLRRTFGSNSHNKHIPFQFKCAPLSVTSHLFKGLVLGDGWCNVSRGLSGYTSVSSELAQDVFDLGLQLGFIGSVNLNYLARGNGRLLPQGTPCPDLIVSHIKWNKASVPYIGRLLYDTDEPLQSVRPSSKSFIHDDKLFVQVKSVTKTDRIENVYNLEVADLHYYIVDRMCSSNSEYFIDFRSGDPFSLIEQGELRLPSWSNMAARHVSLSMPFRASQLGRTQEEMVQFLTGTRPPATVIQEEAMEAGTVMHRIWQDELRRANLLVKAEAPIFEPYSNITGTVDAVVREGRRKVVVELKTTSTARLEEMAGPDRAHRSQLNFYLKGLGLREGMIMYISRENPALTRTFPVGYSQELYQADIARVQQARGTAAELLSQGYGYPGEAYSMLDRMKVLGDTSPYSDEYKRQYQIVNQMDRMGLLTPEEHREKIAIVRRRRSVVRSYDLYPRRFDIRGIFHPDEKYQQMSENQYIKAAAEYNVGERVVGGIWEFLTHQRTPFHSKLLGAYTPREQYERFVLWGRRSSFWASPWRDFVEPYIRASMATRGPGEGVVRGLQAGFLLGGPPGAAVGAGALGVWGAVHGGYRWLTDSTYIPGNIKGKWEMWEYFDKLKYLKARRLYQMTGEEEYAEAMTQTMVGMNPLSRARSSFTEIARSVPYDMRPFVFAWMKEEDPREREAIVEEIPPAVGQLLRIKWSQIDGEAEATERLGRDYRNAIDMTSYYRDRHLPQESWMGWHPSVEIGDVQIKTAEKSGMDAHDFGGGWYCIHPDQYISTMYGSVITMESITQNDSILSRNGNTEKVIKVHTRMASDEVLVTIKVMRNTCDTMSATDNHQVLAIRSNLECIHYNGSGLPVCKPDSYRAACRGCNGKDRYIPEYIPIGDLSPNEYFIAYPRPIYEEHPLSISDVLNLDDYTHTKGHSYTKRVILRGIDHGLMVFNSRRRIKYQIPDISLHDPDIYRLFGYYLAEGYLIRRGGTRSPIGGISLTFHIKETDYTDDIVRIVYDKFGLAANVYTRPRRNTRTVKIHSVALGAMFHALLGEYSYHKSIDPRLFHASPECIAELLKGYFAGDGHASNGSKDNMKMNALSMSEGLIRQLRMMTLSIGIFPSMRSVKKTYGIGWIIELYGDEYRKLYIPGYEYTIPDYYFYRVARTTHEMYTGLVYDLTMDGDPSYCSTIGTYHNSDVRRIKYSPLTPGPINMTDTTNAEVYPELTLNGGEVRQVVDAVLRQYGVMGASISINVTPGVGSRVTMDATVDNDDEYRDALSEASLTTRVPQMT